MQHLREGGLHPGARLQGHQHPPQSCSRVREPDALKTRTQAIGSQL